MTFTYHEGERAVQRRANGTDAADWGAANAIREALPPVAADFLAAQVMVLVGHRAADGTVWASALSGPAGFARAVDDRTVQLAARPVGGDALDASLRAGPVAAGMLAIEPETKRRMRFNGPATLGDAGVELRTEQVFANCPKYINVRAHEPVEASATPSPVERTSELTEAQRAWIEQADTFFIATSHRETGADVSHRGGNPGFVTVHDRRRLSWPDYQGNSMFMTLGNLEADDRAGLLFVDYGTGSLLQVTGRARTDWAAGRAAEVPGAERIVDFDVDAVVVLPGAVGWRWRFIKPSRLSPLPAPTPEPRKDPA